MAVAVCSGCGDAAHPGPCVDPVSTVTEPGEKHDQGKLRYDLLPHGALEQVAQVLTFGADKYGAENWRGVLGWRWRYYGAALRHLSAWWRGEQLDPESGLPHLAHALCCLLFLAEMEDGRGPKPDPMAGSQWPDPSFVRLPQSEG